MKHVYVNIVYYLNISFLVTYKVKETFFHKRKKYIQSAWNIRFQHKFI